MKQSFLVIYRLGSAWVPDQPAKAQPTPAHGRYLLRLFKQGVLQLAGPFADDTGAAIVLQAADEVQARALVDADPAVRQAVFTYELHAWALVPWERYLTP